MRLGSTLCAFPSSETHGSVEYVRRRKRRRSGTGRRAVPCGERRARRHPEPVSSAAWPSSPSSMQERENSGAPIARRHFSFAGAPSTFLCLVDGRERERRESEHSLAPFVRPPLLFRATANARLEELSVFPSARRDQRRCVSSGTVRVQSRGGRICLFSFCSRRRQPKANFKRPAISSHLLCTL